MRVGVLGPVEVTGADGTPADLGTPKQRALLAALVLHRPRTVAVETLVDLVWGDDVPPSPLSSLHGYVSGLRRAVEPSRARRERASVLVTTPPGYALRVGDDAVDAGRFTAAVDAAHRALATAGDLPAAPPGLTPADLADLADRLGAALALWRGTPYQDLDHAAAATAERARLGVVEPVPHRVGAEDDAAIIAGYAQAGVETTAG
ncbi:winged helix-turn-helix domain-containing protein, partial [Dactylosporangium sp. NPDC005572]|uniref:AfsR/SARP family transcriptional regulator n=1 Tax=Dactylosporangium sp. NPDC005572 TaxID=3156889 RepID=UPI0033A404E1